MRPNAVDLAETGRFRVSMAAGPTGERQDNAVQSLPPAMGHGMTCSQSLRTQTRTAPGETIRYLTRHIKIFDKRSGQWARSAIEAIIFVPINPIVIRFCLKKTWP